MTRTPHLTWDQYCTRNYSPATAIQYIYTVAGIYRQMGALDGDPRDAVAVDGAIARMATTSRRASSLRAMWRAHATWAREYEDITLGVPAPLQRGRRARIPTPITITTEQE